MSTEFVGLGDRLLQSEGLVENPKVLRDLTTSMRKFLNLARSAVPTSSEEEEDSSSAPSSPSRPEAPDPGMTRLSGFFPAAGVAMPNCMADFIPSSINHGRFSPSLSYGVLAGSATQADKSMPYSPTPYFIGDLNSFAARLFLDTISTVWKALRGELVIPGYVVSVCRYRFRVELPGATLQRLGQRIHQLRSEGFCAEIAEEEEADASLMDEMRYVTTLTRRYNQSTDG
jgi:hypothetical protein